MRESAKRGSMPKDGEKQLQTTLIEILEPITRKVSSFWAVMANKFPFLFKPILIWLL